MAAVAGVPGMGAPVPFCVAGDDWAVAGGVIEPGVDDCATAMDAVISIKTVGKGKRLCKREGKELKLNAPKCKSERTCSLRANINLTPYYGC